MNLVTLKNNTYCQARYLTTEVEIIVRGYVHKIVNIRMDFVSGKLHILSSLKFGARGFADYRDSWFFQDELVELSPSSPLPVGVKWLNL